MNQLLLNFKPCLILSLSIFVFASCDDDNDFNTNRDITDEFTTTLSVAMEPGDTVLVLDDLESGIAEAVNGILADEEGTEMKSLEIVTVQVISSDLSQLSYMDSLAMYMDAPNPDDILTLEIPESAQLIATAGPDVLAQASLNLNLEQVNIRHKIGRADSYDIYLQPFLNESFDAIEQDRNLEFVITFRALIST